MCYASAAFCDIGKYFFLYHKSVPRDCEMRCFIEISKRHT